MSQFFDAKADIITQAVDGIVAASGGALARLDGYPHTRVVVRADWDRSTVALLSGGGSGHEPAHAGFVGPGMLTAAVCGDVFASPSVEAVLAGILAVTGEAGCLVVVKNYTGDRLNFGLAAERARALGRDVEVVIVADDVALPDIVQPRGVAGTLMVHKIAGTVAERGGSLAEVAGAARRVASGLQTFGLSLSSCTVPGAGREDRIPEGKAELGLGIHGEPGVEQAAFEGAQAAMDTIVSHIPVEGGRYAALLNNLGGTTALEMAVLTRALREGRMGDDIQRIIGPAAMMTALDMHGVSLTLYALTGEDEDLLSAPVPMPAWPGCRAFGDVATVPMPEGLAPMAFAPSSDDAAMGVLRTACEAMLDAEADLNRLDAASGDGDTGSTLAGAARALLEGADGLPLADRAASLRAIGQTLSQSMGGSSGVLLAILFAAAGDAADGGARLPAALRAGLARMQEIGGAGRGDRTMVDALAPALDALPDVAAAARAAREGADATAGMEAAKAGRSAYVGADQLRGNTDPGAEAVARLLEALAGR